MKNKAINILTTILLIFAVLAVCIGAATLGRDEGKTSHVHSFRTVGTTATCTEGGIRTEMCVSCKQTRTTPEEALGHTFVGSVCACGERDVDLITFTIDDTTYCAENGMTWGEWVESEYNTTHLGVRSTGYIGWDPEYSGDSHAQVYGFTEQDYIVASDPIMADGEYVVEANHSGGSNM